MTQNHRREHLKALLETVISEEVLAEEYMELNKSMETITLQDNPSSPTANPTPMDQTPSLTSEPSILIHRVSLTFPFLYIIICPLFGFV